jgi:hypothetical protein
MSTTANPLAKLSHGDLDALINYGISQQEQVQRHGTRYQHLLNVVAKSKAEKQKRVDDGDFDYGTTKDLDFHKIAESIKDDQVEESQLAAANPDELNLAPAAPKGTAKEVKNKKTPKAPKPTDPNAETIPADHINQGLPGVMPNAAEDTPENTI